METILVVSQILALLCLSTLCIYLIVVLLRFRTMLDTVERDVKEIADSIVELERRVQDRVEGPILDTVAFIAAVFKGVRTFVERVRV